MELLPAGTEAVRFDFLTMASKFLSIFLFVQEQGPRHLYSPFTYIGSRCFFKLNVPQHWDRKAWSLAHRNHE